MRIYLEVQSGPCPSLHIGERFPLRVAPESSVSETRRRISERLSIPTYAVILGFDNKILLDDTGSLEEKGIGNNAVLALHLADSSGGYNTKTLDGILGSALLNFGTSCGISDMHGSRLACVVPCFDSEPARAPPDYIDPKNVRDYGDLLVNSEAVVSNSAMATVSNMQDPLSVAPLWVSSEKGIKSRDARAVRRRNLISNECTDFTVVRF